MAIFEAALAACAGCTLEATLAKDLGLSQSQGGELQSGVISLQRSLALNPKDLDTLRALGIAERTSPSPELTIPFLPSLRSSFTSRTFSLLMIAGFIYGRFSHDR